jgi:hypothetical protein
MRARCWMLGWWAAVLGALAGCRTTADQIRPPERPEEYPAPPEDDPRYNAPPQFPKSTLNQGPTPRVGGPGENPLSPNNRIPGTTFGPKP